jgi:hypothetical protein
MVITIKPSMPPRPNSVRIWPTGTDPEADLMNISSSENAAIAITINKLLFRLLTNTPTMSKQLMANITKRYTDKSLCTDHALFYHLLSNKNRKKRSP